MAEVLNLIPKLKEKIIKDCKDRLRKPLFIYTEDGKLKGSSIPWGREIRENKERRERLLKGLESKHE